MSASLRVAWQDGVYLSQSDGELTVAGPGSRLTLRGVASPLIETMARLTPPGEDENRLADRLSSAGEAPLLTRWFYYLEQFNRRGFLRRSLLAGDRPLAELIPLGAAAVSTRCAFNPRASYVLSRFAWLRRFGKEMTLECATTHYRIALHEPWAMAVVGALASPMTISALAERFGDLPAEAVEALVRLLADSGMAAAAGAEAESHPALEAWEFHDLMFHARSRRGRSAAAFGGTYRLAPQPPPAAIDELAADEWHELYRPDLNRLRSGDPPLADVQERRRSIREYAARPITARQLGEFLFRVARITDLRESEVPTPAGNVLMEFAPRPYPSGGALYELEFYVAARNCEGLAPGLYRYLARSHRLARRRGPTADVERLIAEAGASAGIAADKLQTLVVLAARFPRIAWKYESIAYALTLKHAGVVYQTMYLAATAMGLAPCAIGCGDADLFARAAGVDYYEETSVGEFLLGSARRGPGGDCD